jgi:hypothetical protein
MTLALLPLQLKNRQIRQSVFTLLVFLASFFAHSGHFAQVEFDAVSTFEMHDCNLCQQGIDSPPAPLALLHAKESTYCLIGCHHSDVKLVCTNYVSPPLRAPPSLL